LTSVILRDLKASRSFSLTAVKGSCGWRERRAVVLCFLKRRVVARESAFACFGGWMSRVNKISVYSSNSKDLAHHFCELQI
jgi:hypothetical protein